MQVRVFVFGPALVVKLAEAAEMPLSFAATAIPVAASATTAARAIHLVFCIASLRGSTAFLDLTMTHGRFGGELAR